MFNVIHAPLQCLIGCSFFTLIHCLKMIFQEIVLNETKCSIYTPHFIDGHSSVAHTIRGLRLSDASNINLTFHNIYSSDSNQNTSVKDDAVYLVCDETTDRV